jgi:hypothetical protein
VEDDCEDAANLPPLSIKYEPAAGLRLENTGATWKVLTYLLDLQIQE